jgi:CO/xanthine dehydrogenase Mo-binding subunit
VSRIGTSPSRPDGLPKVAGQAVYADDFVVAGMQFGATLRSPHARARIRRLEWHPERAPAGAVFVSAADIPGANGVQLIDDAWPVLANGEVHYVGEAVALVAASSRLDAQRALRAIEVEYEPLDPVLDWMGGADLERLCDLSMGDDEVEDALAAADVRLSGTYRTGYQEHIYIECNAMTAWFEGEDSLTVMGSMQCPYYVHKSLAHTMGLEADSVRVKASVVGGGFGGKEDYPSLIAIHAALLARATGTPVRIAYDRHEDIVATTKRHPAEVTIRAGISRDGILQALDIDVDMDGGAFNTLSPVVLSRAMLHAGGPYRCPSVRVNGRVLRTNTVPNGAFRGFGAPQTQFAIERHMDRLARRLGLDPYEIRHRNALIAGDSLPTGQVLDSSAALYCLERVERETDFRRRWSEAEEVRRVTGQAGVGVGLSLFFHGGGFTGNGERRMQSPVTVAVRDAGRGEGRTAMTDMGQGCAAVFPQIASEASGLMPEDLVFVAPDTGLVPDSGPTVASRTTMVVGSTIARALQELRAQILDWWRADQGAEGPLEIVESEVRNGEQTWSFEAVSRAYLAAEGPLEVTLRHRPPDWQEFDEDTYEGSAYPTYSWGADVVDVRVDPVTLEVRADAITAVCEVGTVIHPVLCAGQIEGGTLQSVAWAYMEEIKLDQGRYLNDRLATYIIPTARDCPRIDVHFIEDPYEGGPFGAKGVGELPMDGGAPACASAIENATGLHVASIPATPERLQAWLEADQRIEEGPDEG